MSFGQLKGSLVGGNNSIPNPLPATGSVVVAAGDLIVALIAQQTANTSTGCGDNLHGASTYTAQNAGSLSTISGRLWFKVVTTPGTLTTVNFVTTASANDASCCAAVFAGPFVSSPLDATPTNLTADTTTPYSCPASGTLAQAVELVVGWLAATANVTYAAGTGYTIGATQAQSANASSAICYQIVATTGTTTPSFTGTAPSSDVLGTASFKADLTQTTFRNVEWMGDVPIAREFHVGLRTWLQATTARMPAPVATYMPSRVLDWGTVPPIDFPNSLLTWTQEAQLAPPTPPTIPFVQDDWPVPVAPVYSVSLRTFIAINPPLLATSPPPPILMPPLIVEWGVSDRTTFEPARIQYNAPLLTAPVTVTKPFVQADWPVPPTPQRAADLRTFINDTPIQLIGKDALPVRQQNWLVPIAPDYSVSLRSFLASPALPLITAPIVTPPTFMPGRVSEWGMWDRVPFSAAPIANLTLSLPEAVAVTYVFREPYYSPQWAGPRFETWTTSVNIALRAGPPAQKPFTQTDWPLTPAARQPDRTYQRAFHPELVGQDRLPIRQQSWPLPVPVAPVNDLRTFIGPPQKQPVVIPFRQSDWPVPIATDFSNALRSIGFRSPALDVVVAVIRPFVQSDWPVPTAQRPAADLRTHIQKTPIQLIGKDRLPIRQQDWPLPIAPRPAADLRTYIAQSPIRLIGKDRLPFRQMHWPVPLAPLEFHTLRSITQGRVIYGGEVARIPPEPPLPPPEVIHSVRAHADAYYGVFYADEIKGRADFSRAKGLNDEEAAN